MALINDRSKEMRLKRGLTLIEVADYIGVKDATIQRYESGNIKNIKHEIICKLAELFKCDPCYLMGWSEDTNIISNNKSNITNSAVIQGNNATTLIVKNGDGYKKEISEQAVELLRIFEALNVKEQTELLSFAFKLEENHRQNKQEVINNEKT